MKNFKHYNVIILGAGIAGIPCALFLKKYNINNILILNKNTNNVHKACSGILTKRSLDILKEIGITPNDYCKWAYVKAYYNDKYVRTYDSNDVFAYQNIGLNRISLDNQLFEKLIEEKIEIIENVNNIFIDKKNNRVNEFTYDYLIDARGYSLLASKKKKKIIGIEAKINAKNNNESNVAPSIYLNTGLKGYGWVVSNDNVTTIGFTDLYKNNYDLKGNLVKFGKKQGFVIDIKNDDIRAAFIPIKPERKIIDKNIILIGERAGLTDPLTQEGIFYSLYSAKIGAQAIYNKDVLEYKKVLKPVIKSLRKASFYRKIFFTRFIQGKMWNIAQKHKFTTFVFSKYSNLDFFDYNKIFNEYKAEFPFL